MSREPPAGKAPGSREPSVSGTVPRGSREPSRGTGRALGGSGCRAGAARRANRRSSRGRGPSRGAPPAPMPTHLCTGCGSTALCRSKAEKKEEKSALTHRAGASLLPLSLLFPHRDLDRDRAPKSRAGSFKLAGLLLAGYALYLLLYQYYNIRF